MTNTCRVSVKHIAISCRSQQRTQTHTELFSTFNTNIAGLSELDGCLL